MWVDHVDFNNIVATDWAKPMAGTPGLKFWRKLVRLKHTLKRWNWTVFGHIFKKKTMLLEKIQTLELDLQRGWTENTHTEWDLTRKELTQVESWEQELLCHNPRMDWVKDGDRNTAFYHAVIRDKKKRQQIQLARDDESITSNASEIETLAQIFSLSSSRRPHTISIKTC